MTTRHFSYLIPILLAAVMSLSACVGQDYDKHVASIEASVAVARSAGPADLEKELNDYVECLRKEGLQVPDPTVDGDGRLSIRPPTGGQSFDRDTLDKAQQVCGDLPKGLTFGLEGMDQSELQDIALKFAQCMREHGVNLPDPDLSGLGSGGSPFGKINRDDPKLAAAIDACQKVWTAGTFGAGVKS